MKNLWILSCLILACSCSSDSETENLTDVDQNVIVDSNGNSFDLGTVFNIDFNNLDNYANQTVPNYINEDNTPGNNQITDNGATLGRILFYDTNLSVDNTISCASCHQQAFAFSDADAVSTGVNGVTARHSMRLINARFGDEDNFFWDERANSLEEQTTMPIQDHTEMGFSGQDGNPDFTALVAKLENEVFYPELFNRTFGTTEINESRIQQALAQFIRSIQSFDSKFDEGRSSVNNNNQAFPNFTDQENLGKQLFMQDADLNNQGIRVNGGLGCANCHGAPEFAISQNRDNNGVIGVFGSSDTDLNVTRSPTLRDLVGLNGESNGAFFHDASANTLQAVLEHYNSVDNNPNLDNRLRAGNNGQQLQMTNDEMQAVIAFLETLTGSNVYVDTKWSDPFLSQ